MEKDLILLSADTSSSRLSIALFKGQRLIDEFESGPFNRHSSGIVPEIEKLLSENSCLLEDIHAFCVGLGPGSFTGLRVGLTAIRGMALALRKPIVGIPSIDGMAYNLFGQQGRICIIIDAKQKRIYSRIYNSNKNRMKPVSRFLLVGIKELLGRVEGGAIFLGDGIRLYRDDIFRDLGKKAIFAPEPLWYPKAAIIGRLGLERLRQGRRDNPFNLSPLYIYPKECQIRKHRAKG